MMKDSNNAAAAAAEASHADLVGEEAIPLPPEPQMDAVPVETTAQQPTLRDVFAVPAKVTDRGDDHWQAFQNKLAEEAKGIKWTAAMPDLGAKICELLDIRLHDILLTAWKKVESLREVLENSRKSPDKSTYLDLAEHSIDYATKPFIDVKIKGLTAKKITLHVALNLKLKGFTLKVRNGMIREIQTGSCEVKGTIKYEKLPIAEKKLAPIKFPLSIRVPEINLAVPPSLPESAKTSAAAATSGSGAPGLLDEETKAQAPVERIEL